MKEWAVGCIADNGLVVEARCELMVKLVGKIYPYRIEKKSDVESALQESTDNLKQFIDLGLTLPQCVRDDRVVIATLAKVEVEGYTHMDLVEAVGKAIEAHKAPDNKRVTCFLTIFAVSKYGRTVLKDPATLIKEAAQGVVAQDQIAAAAATPC